jgi:phosphonate utilization transcriptional regulator
MTAPLNHLRILQTKSVADLVREEIIGLIKCGDLVAGDKLNELSFAQHFSVSRAPIREAFRALEEAGLVKLEKNRGVFVREIGEPEAHELYELRATLDDMAGRQLAPRITPELLTELGVWLARLDKAAQAGSMTTYFPLNIEFHDRLVELTGNRTLIEFYRKVIDRMHLLRRRNFGEGQGSAQSQEEHRAIVTALATGRPDLAAGAMRRHVMNGYARLTGKPLEP